MLPCVLEVKIKKKKIQYNFNVHLQCLLLFNMSKLKKPKSILYTTELSLPAHFNIPRKIYIPQIPEPPAIQTLSLGIEPEIITGNQEYFDLNI